MDASSATSIALIVLQIIQLVLQAYVTSHSARRARSASQRREQREQVNQNLSFLTTKHEAVDQRTAILQEWMDALLTAKGLPHSSSGKESDIEAQ
jgi:hypothetical protein